LICYANQFEVFKKTSCKLFRNCDLLIVGAFIRVREELGPGLLESCYHNALFFELKSLGLSVGYNAPFNVFYKGELQALMLIHERACICTSMYIGW